MWHILFDCNNLREKPKESLLEIVFTASFVAACFIWQQYIWKKFWFSKYESREKPRET